MVPRPLMLATGKSAGLSCLLPSLTQSTSKVPRLGGWERGGVLCSSAQGLRKQGMRGCFLRTQSTGPSIVSRSVVSVDRGCCPSLRPQAKDLLQKRQRTEPRSTCLPRSCSAIMLQVSIKLASTELAPRCNTQHL